MTRIDRSLDVTQVLREVEERELLGRPRISDDGKAVVGDLSLGDRVAPLRVVHSSALTLPVLVMDPPDALGALPHVDWSGIVCYQEKESLLLDRRKPGEVLAFAVAKARHVLQEGLHGTTNAAEYAAEFASIWNRRGGMDDVFSVLPVGDDVREVIILSVPGGALYLMDDEADLVRFYGGGLLKRARNVRRALYVPVRGSTGVLPPPALGPIWTPREIREGLLGALTPEHRKEIEAWARRRSGKEVDFFFFGLPTGSDGYSVFGLRFGGCGDPHPLCRGGTARNVTALRVRRLDRDFLMPRGGAMAELNDRSALLVGCGAVGGFIATELARTGVGRLDLLDADTLGEENTYRHVLGQASWGKSKAQELAKVIASNVPYVEVEGIAKTFLQAASDHDIDPSAYDMVFAATGDTTFELHLNEILVDRGGPLTIFAWVDPLGIGGHAMLVCTANGGGCLECAVTSPDDPSADGGDRLSFAAPGQEFGRELAGCGSLHTPFSSLDANRTATLAVALGVRALLGEETHNCAESWRGRADAFRAQGYVTSNRFEASEAQLHEQRWWEPSPRCPICHP